MIEVKEGLGEELISLFFQEINKTNMKRSDFSRFSKKWWDQKDLNLRPPGYEPGALTN